MSANESCFSRSASLCSPSSGRHSPPYARSCTVSTCVLRATGLRGKCLRAASDTRSSSSGRLLNLIPQHGCARIRAGKNDFLIGLDAAPAVLVETCFAADAELFLLVKELQLRLDWFVCIYNFPCSLFFACSQPVAARFRSLAAARRPRFLASAGFLAAARAVMHRHAAGP